MLGGGGGGGGVAGERKSGVSSWVPTGGDAVRGFKTCLCSPARTQRRKARSKCRGDGVACASGSPTRASVAYSPS